MSVAQLARSVGVTRQAIYAIEAGSYLPNTVVSLQLARALETKVHDLFVLHQAGPSIRARRKSL
jgi:putative molybdopterin biosynthesis protein